MSSRRRAQSSGILWTRGKGEHWLCPTTEDTKIPVPHSPGNRKGVEAGRWITTRAGHQGRGGRFSLRVRRTNFIDAELAFANAEYTQPRNPHGYSGHPAGNVRWAPGLGLSRKSGKTTNLCSSSHCMFPGGFALCASVSWMS